MSSNQCSFCSKKNIPGPHGHSIRDFTKKNQPITCPQLLSISCGYCHEKGHTVKYCHVLKDKKLSHNNTDCFVVEESRPNKRNIEIDHDGFIHKPQKHNAYINNSYKTEPKNAFTSYFAALDIENSDDDSDVMEENVSKSNIDNNSTVWTKIVSENNSNKKQWSDDISNEGDIYYGDN